MGKSLFTETRKSFDQLLEWTITIPRFRITSTQKRKRIIPIRFQVKNNSETRVLVRIQITSSSPLLQFQSTSVKALGRNRVSEESATLTQIKKIKLSSQQSQTFKFTAHYYPHLTVQSISQIGLEYTVAAFDRTGKILTHTDPFQIILSLTSPSVKR